MDPRESLDFVTWLMLWSCAVLQGQFHSTALQPVSLDGDSDSAVALGWREVGLGLGTPGVFLGSSFHL